MGRNWNSHTLLVGVKDDADTWTAAWHLLKCCRVIIQYSNSTLSLCLGEIKAYVHIGTWTKCS